MESSEFVDFCEIKMDLAKAMAICSVMTGYGDDEDLSSKAVRGLGAQILEKLQNIQEKLNF